LRNRRVAYVLIFEELRIKITEIDNRRRAAERELEALQNPKVLISELEADRDALLDSPADVAPDALNSLAPEERHHVYKMLKLRVVAHSNEALEVSGAFGDGLAVCAPERGRVSPSGRSSSATSSASTWASM
jgi:hypothetical protein